MIVAPGTPAAVAAKQATGTIPIVFAGVADAIGAGLVANFARPAANITPLTSNSAQLGGKRLELLKTVVPKASRTAVLYNPGDRSNVLASTRSSKDPSRATYLKAAKALGVTIPPSLLVSADQVIGVERRAFVSGSRFCSRKKEQS